jgi:glutaconyl-CoA/methylmalonyl-CoA decarboxylase subunit gamma
MSMNYVAASGGQTRRLEVSAERGVFRVCLDEREFPLDVLQVGPALYSLLIGGRSYEVDLLEVEGALMVLVDGQPFRVEIRRDREASARTAAKRPAAPTGKETVTAPMPGKVTKILVAVGQAVRPGDGIVVMEAMKMENELKASRGGTVAEIRVEEGRPVNGGDVLVVIEGSEGEMARPKIEGQGEEEQRS